MLGPEQLVSALIWIFTLILICGIIALPDLKSYDNEKAFTNFVKFW